MDKSQAVSDVDQQVVIFRLAESSYAVDIASVREIIRPQPITFVPQAPPCVVGVINLRSSIVPVLDLRSRCGLAPAEQTRDSRVVVVQVGDQSVGLQVDAVSEVTTLPVDAVEPAAGLIRGNEQSQLLRGVARLDDRLVMLLDLSRAIDTSIQLDLALDESVPTSTQAA
jgi:purine-binding chemotaxis protein CheW